MNWPIVRKITVIDTPSQEVISQNYFYIELYDDVMTIRASFVVNSLSDPGMKKELIALQVYTYKRDMIAGIEIFKDIRIEKLYATRVVVPGTEDIWLYFKTMAEAKDVGNVITLWMRNRLTITEIGSFKEDIPSA